MLPTDGDVAQVSLRDTVGRLERGPASELAGYFRWSLRDLSLASRCCDISLVDNSDCPHSCRRHGLHLYRPRLTRTDAGPGGTV